MLSFEFCNNLTCCTKNMDISLIILCWHVRAGHLQYLRNLEVDLTDAEDNDELGLSTVLVLEADRNHLATLARQESDTGSESVLSSDFQNT